jgi:hypothetical protein
MPSKKDSKDIYTRFLEEIDRLEKKVSRTKDPEQKQQLEKAIAEIRKLWNE